MITLYITKNNNLRGINFQIFEIQQKNDKIIN